MMSCHSRSLAKWTTMCMTTAPSAYPMVYEGPCGKALTIPDMKLTVEMNPQEADNKAGIQPTNPKRCRFSFGISLDRFIDRVVTYLRPPSTRPDNAGISLDHEFLPLRPPRMRGGIRGSVCKSGYLPVSSLSLSPVSELSCRQNSSLQVTAADAACIPTTVAAAAVQGGDE